MKASIEISLYPLKENYKKVVLGFIGKLNKNKKLKIETNGMSTQIFGDFEEIMKVLTVEILQIFKNNKAIFILKIGAGELRYGKKAVG